MEKYLQNFGNKKTRRNVILLVTTVSDLLNNGEYFIDKLKTIIEFCGKREDITLIWRPHPLELSTLRSMRPNLLTKYLGVLETFKAFDENIYDETADYQRSILIADAFIGTVSSSLVRLFGVTGKPMFFIDPVTAVAANKTINIGTVCAGFNNSEVLLFALRFNALFSVNLISKEINYVKSFEIGKESHRRMYSCVAEYQDRFYYIPSTSSSITVYEKNTQNVSYIKLQYKKRGNYDFILNNNELWLFPVYYLDYIYKINLDNHDVESKEIIELENILKEKEINIGNMPVFTGCIQVGNEVVRICRFIPYVYCYDLISGESRFIEINGIKNNLYGIAYDGVDFWLLTTESDGIMIWNMESNEVKEILNYPLNINAGNLSYPFSTIFYDDGNIWIIPGSASRIVKIDVKSKEMKCIDFNIKGLERVHEGAFAFFAYEFKDNKLFLFPYECNYIVCIDLLTDEVSGISTCWDTRKCNDENGWINLMVNHSAGYAYDETFCQLDEFLDVIQNNSDAFGNKRKEYYIGDTANKNGTTGTEIWKKVLENI